MAEVTEIVIWAADSQIGAATVNYGPFENKEHRGIVLYLDLNSVSGTNPTLDIKLQAEIPNTGLFVDIPGAAFTQKAAADANSQDSLMIYPGIGETANETISDVLPGSWRMQVTVGGTDTPTFSDATISGYLLP